MSEQAKSQTMLERILATPSAKELIEQGLLPGSCELHLETALTYARKAAKGEEGAIDVVIEHLEEIKAKIKKAREA